MIPEGFEPMLASPLKKGELPKFPCLVSPKLDGVRAISFGGVLYSRKLKKIPNKLTQERFSDPRFAGFDGELVLGDHDAEVFRRTSSAVMSFDKEESVVFHVFDIHPSVFRGGFDDRLAELERRCAPISTTKVQVVPHRLVTNEQELSAAEEEFLKLGYEGLMVRSLHGPYKHGRSTVKEGYLLKLKRFEDSEAEVLECLELSHNMNVATKNELGRTKRSGHKAGKVAGGVLGALRVRDIKTGVEFQIGSGFNADEKKELWERRDSLIGKFVKYSYFPMGSKEKPRFPVFHGFRDPIDM